MEAVVEFTRHILLKQLVVSVAQVTLDPVGTSVAPIQLLWSVGAALARDTDEHELSRLVPERLYRLLVTAGLAARPVQLRVR